MKPKYRVDQSVRRKIAAHLVTQFGYSISHILPLVPEIMESWSKVRIQEGDYIRTKSNIANQEGRDQSFIRVSLISCLRTHTHI